MPRGERRVVALSAPELNFVATKHRKYELEGVRLGENHPHMGFLRERTRLSQVE